MANKFKNIQHKARAKTSFLPGSKQVSDWPQTLTDARHWVVTISILTILAAWIALSMKNNNLFLREALISASIISAMLFFQAAERKSNVEQ